MFVVFNLEVVSTLTYSMRIMFRKLVVVMSDFENDHEWSEESSLPPNSSNQEDSSSSDVEQFDESNQWSIVILEIAFAANQT